MMDADKRDSAVAFIEADPDRIEIIRLMEKKAEPLTLDFLDTTFPSLSEGKIVNILTALEKKEIIRKMSESPPTWDFTLFGHEILYAVDRPAQVNKLSPFRLLRRIVRPLRRKLTD